ncbi:MAG: tetratricopeptide repeat protein [Clostridiales bacterium]|jgi:tetratricopeptide (TPR) repeat protein|nr:tetratricopeptide repeat protein [Clostridiales bacterium]
MSTDLKIRLRRYALLAVFFAVFVIEILILGWPMWYLFVTYLALLLVTLFIKREALRGLLANYYLGAGRIEQARGIYQRMAAANVKYPAIYLNYATLILKEGRAAEALELLQRALGLNPRVITEKNIRLTIGSCYWVLGQLDKAIETLETLRAKHEYINAHAMTTLGYMYFEKGELEKALEISEAAVEDSPEHASAWDNLGQIYLKKEDLSTAREKFTKALEYNPELADSNYFLGIIAERENNPEEAREYFEKASRCKINALNTVTADEVAEKLKKYTEG